MELEATVRLSEDNGASDALLEPCWGGRGSRWRQNAGFPAWMEFKFVSKAASVPGMISHLAYAF